ncbi:MULTISPECIES: hypothetical protein [unclassified Nostoc]|uniref:hypothetical protein n=1 Tax=unclassified Nostoc TaxID=2593658 RepID=UPI002AD41C58|nr:hypothetical protein [Nostoc sp. DedQUE03]MDZ7975757.1 hypothetical protein [Nostoc sp. DedQUE03]MDZ8048289.1 hypothetical protein [Nostoc sp. DedQUE02]
MTLPDDHNPKEFLQDVFKKSANKEVARFFGDLGENWELSLADGRSQLRTACTHQENDTTEMTNLRHSLLYDILGYSKNGLVLFYGSKESQEPPVIGHPKIVFYFSQDAQAVPNEEYKADAEYSVRLMTLENTSSNLHSKLLEIANEIKVQFVDAKKGIVLTKGNLCVSYKDVEHGFANGSKILTNTEGDAIDIYRRICNTIDAPFDETKITVHNPKKPSTIGLSSGTQIIMGKVRKKRAYRRVVNVRFRYAYALIPGEPQPVFLIDTTYKYAPLVKL